MSSILAGVTLCGRKCGRDAELELEREPLCFDCLEELLDHELAVEISPEAARLIATARLDPVPARRPWRAELDPDQTKLVELRRQWLAERGKVRDDARCHALLWDGSRCVRGAVVDGYLCHTHAEVGGRMPGLGWREGKPCGNIVPIRRPA